MEFTWFTRRILRRVENRLNTRVVRQISGTGRGESGVYGTCVLRDRDSATTAEGSLGHSAQMDYGDFEKDWQNGLGEWRARNIVHDRRSTHYMVCTKNVVVTYSAVDFFRFYTLSFAACVID